MINFIADLHIDHNVHLEGYILNKCTYCDAPLSYEDKEIVKLTVREYIDECISNTFKKAQAMLLNGDISNRNYLSKIAIDYLLEKYERIYVIMGNHEYYLGTALIPRPKDLMGHYADNTNVIFLDKDENIGKVYKEGCITFAGSCMMYNIDDPTTNSQFFNFMNDSRFISEDEARRMHKIGQRNYNLTKDNIDVYFSHIPIVPVKPIKPNCYYTEVDTLNPDVLHVSGHTHKCYPIIRSYNNTPVASCSIGYTGYREQNEHKFYTLFVENDIMKLK